MKIAIEKARRGEPLTDQEMLLVRAYMALCWLAERNA